MQDASFSGVLISFMMDVVILAGVPLGVATVIGLIISFFQAITQIQDQTLSQTAKIASIVVVLIVFGGALTAPLITSTRHLFDNFAMMIH